MADLFIIIILGLGCFYIGYLTAKIGISEKLNCRDFEEFEKFIVKRRKEFNEKD